MWEKPLVMDFGYGGDFLQARLRLTNWCGDAIWGWCRVDACVSRGLVSLDNPEQARIRQNEREKALGIRLSL